jgi:predicted dehydrogenase
MNERRTRREFLRNTAAAATAAGVFPALLSADDGAEDTPIERAQARAPLGPSDPVRVAVIGTGGMGTAHAQAFATMVKDGRPVKLDALCDVCDPRLQKAKQAIDGIQGGDITVYRRFQDVLARPDLHGVLIAAPEHSHAYLAEAAIKAGKDVYLEKPMTLNLKDAMRLKKVVDANPQAVFCVGTQFVMGPSYIAAEQLIADGAIGKPVWSQTSYCRNSKAGEWTYYEIDPAWKPGENLDWKTWCQPLKQIAWNPEIYARWRRFRHYSTGIIGDLLVHQMTPLVKAMRLGWPVRVAATGGHYIDKQMENHDQVNLTIQFEQEHTMVVVGSTCNELGIERIIHGNKGNLFVGGRNTTLRPERIWAEEVEERTIPAPADAPTDDQQALRLHWLDCIRTRQKPRADVELGTKIMVIVDLATRAIWDGGGAYGFDPANQKVKRL